MKSDPSRQLPSSLLNRLRRHELLPSRFVLTVNVTAQTMRLWELARECATGARFPNYRPRKIFSISTSAYGTGQVKDSNQTPLGLHRVAKKIGGLIGTVFSSRKPVGSIWQGQPKASIVHRILWLEGMEPGYNRGGKVDTFNRYIYIHGFGDETTLGRPASHGCIHVAAQDLIPLFDLVPVGTQVWISKL